MKGESEDSEVSGLSNLVPFIEKRSTEKGKFFLGEGHELCVRCIELEVP